MNSTDWTAAHDAALSHFLDTWNRDTATELATKLTCTEAESLASLMQVSGRDDLAAVWINTHSHGDDDETDRHHRTPGVALLLELEELVASSESVELREEDPDGFGAGHLVLYRGNSERLAFTEYNNTDDPEHIDGWHWQQDHHSPTGGPTHIDATGTHAATDIKDLILMAKAWVTL